LRNILFRISSRLTGSPMSLACSCALRRMSFRDEKRSLAFNVVSASSQDAPILTFRFYHYHYVTLHYIKFKVKNMRSTSETLQPL